MESVKKANKTLQWDSYNSNAVEIQVWRFIYGFTVYQSDNWSFMQISLQAHYYNGFFACNCRDWYLESV